jgi:hypothetical protein
MKNEMGGAYRTHGKDEADVTKPLLNCYILLTNTSRQGVGSYCQPLFCT